MLINLFLALACVRAPAFLQRIGLGKKGTVILSLINALAWVPLVIGFLVCRQNTLPYVIALLWLVNLVPATFLTIQVDNWLANIVPNSVLGSYLGKRQAIKSAFYLVALLSLGYLLDSSEGDVSKNFAFVFCSGLVGSLVVVAFLRRLRDNADVGRHNQDKISLRVFIAELRENRLSNYFLFTYFFCLSVNLCGPLYAVYMLNELHFSYLYFTIIISLEYLAKIVSAPFWGRFADQAGNIRVISIVSRLIPFLPICWLFSANIIYLSAVQMLSGILWGAFDLCTQSYLYKMSPDTKKLRYIAYNKSILLLCTAIGGLLGAICYGETLPIFGSSILGIFLISGILRMVVVVRMVPNLIDLALGFKDPPTAPSVSEETMRQVLASKKGLFYSQHINTEKAELLDKKDIVLGGGARDLTTTAIGRQGRRNKLTTADSSWPEVAVPKHIARLTTGPKGLYYSKEAWAKYWHQTAAGLLEPKDVRQVARKITDGLYYNYKSDTLRKYREQTPKISPESLSLAEKGRALKVGLYYSPDRWASYKKQTSEIIMKERQDTHMTRPDKKTGQLSWVPAFSASL